MDPNSRIPSIGYKWDLCSIVLFFLPLMTLKSPAVWLNLLRGAPYKPGIFAAITKLHNTSGSGTRTLEYPRYQHPVLRPLCHTCKCDLCSIVDRRFLYERYEFGVWRTERRSPRLTIDRGRFIQSYGSDPRIWHH